MSMELISREKAIDMINEHEYSSYVDCMEVSDVLDDVPTVKAIPLEVVEQIRAEIELEKQGYPPSADYYKAIMKTLQIIDKYRQERL